MRSFCITKNMKSIFQFHPRTFQQHQQYWTFSFGVTLRKMTFSNLSTFMYSFWNETIHFVFEYIAFSKIKTWMYSDPTLCTQITFHLLNERNYSGIVVIIDNISFVTITNEMLPSIILLLRKMLRTTFFLGFSEKP